MGDSAFNPGLNDGQGSGGIPGGIYWKEVVLQGLKPADFIGFIGTTESRALLQTSLS
jgi:hypothetical protein